MREDYCQYLAELDLSKRILEIGPLENPIILKTEGNVFYADVLNTEELRAHYKAAISAHREEHIHVDLIVPIDYKIVGSYTESLQHVEKFDYIIMSHVMEHFPRLLATFQDLAGVLKPGGTLYTFLPDHRYCYDRFRQPTSFAEAYYTHSKNLPCPPWRTLDYVFEKAFLNQPYLYWMNAQTSSWNLLSPPVSFGGTLGTVLNLPADEAANIHHSVFSPVSFLLLLSGMLRENLLPFQIQRLFNTPPSHFSFGAALTYCPEILTNDALRENELKTMVTQAIRLKANRNVACWAYAPEKAAQAPGAKQDKVLEINGSTSSTLPENQQNCLRIDSFAFKRAEVEPQAPFDTIILNHAMERFPRLLETFADLTALLRPDGELYCLVTDQRYSQDHFRTPTSFAELWYIHDEEMPMAPWRALEQRLEETREDNPVVYWKEDLTGQYCMVPGRAETLLTDIERRMKPQRSLRYNIFTPFSFLLLVHDMLRANIWPFALECFIPAHQNEGEFKAIFRHTPEIRNNTSRRDRERAKIVTLMDEYTP